MYIEEIAPGIYQFENFISKDTAQFIINSIPKSLMGKAQNGNTYGYFGSMYPPYLYDIASYNDDSSHNIAIDLLTGFTRSIADIMAYVYEENHILKQSFYSCMEVGGYNHMHTDNSYIDASGAIIPRGPDGKWAKDKSGLIYFNDQYEGGILRFPNQNLELKPQVGTLLIFEGTYEKPHEVTEVTRGTRYNFITFYEPHAMSKDTLFNNDFR